MKFYLLFVAVFGVATAELAKFTQCEESSPEVCEVTEVQITPCGKSSCNLKKGHESSIQFDFIPKFAADKLTTGLFWASPNGDVSFDDFSNVDACQYTACPTLAGQKQTLTYSLRLSKKLPNENYQLRGLENMYAEVLQLLGVRKPANLPKPPTWEARLSSKRRYGSMSSLPSSSVSSRPVREKRRSSNEHRKKHDLKGISKRFQRLESHVVTLARSVAHLSSEMRTHHLVMQEMDNIRAEIAALRHMYKSQQYIRSGHHRHLDPYSFSNPDRVKRLTKFFGDEPPLMRLFLKKLGYEKYAALLEKEKVGAAELPYVGEDKLRALGVPLGPRMRILKEAGIHQDLHHMSRDDHNTTTTTLAIV